MADAHGSGPCVRKDVRVQLPPRPLDVYPSPCSRRARAGGRLVRPVGVRPPRPARRASPPDPHPCWSPLGVPGWSPFGFPGWSPLGVPGGHLWVCLAGHLWVSLVVTFGGAWLVTFGFPGLLFPVSSGA